MALTPIWDSLLRSNKHSCWRIPQILVVAYSEKLSTLVVAEPRCRTTRFDRGKTAARLLEENFGAVVLKVKPETDYSLGAVVLELPR